MNDADRLGRDPTIRWIIGGKAIERGGASTSQMGRFETELLSMNEKLAAIADLPGAWIDMAHRRKPLKKVSTAAKSSNKTDLPRLMFQRRLDLLALRAALLLSLAGVRAAVLWRFSWTSFCQRAKRAWPTDPSPTAA